MSKVCMSCNLLLGANDMPFKDKCPYCKGDIKLDLVTYCIKHALKDTNIVFNGNGDYLGLLNLVFIVDSNQFSVKHGETKNFMLITGLNRADANEEIKDYLDSLEFWARDYKKSFPELNFNGEEIDR